LNEKTAQKSQKHEKILRELIKTQNLSVSPSKFNTTQGSAVKSISPIKDKYQDEQFASG